MRIHVLSDLHLELARCDFVAARVDADVVVLAGDIHNHDHGISWAQASFPDVPVLYLAGNHEYYGGHWDGLIAQLRSASRATHVAILEEDQVVLGGVRFLGATLWTDFGLFGPATVQSSMRAAHAMMYDFRRIAWSTPPQSPVAESGVEPAQGPPGSQPVVPAQPRWITPADTVDRHNQSRAWLERALSEPFVGPTVVITHHLPSPRSVAERYCTDPVSAAFASDLESMIQRYAPTLWIHGHTHDTFDYRIGSTRVVCNPRGYALRSGSIENPAFVPDLVIEI